MKEECRGPRFLLKSVVEIGVPALDKRARAGEKIGGTEQRSPRFVLTHVHAFMRARHVFFRDALLSAAAIALRAAVMFVAICSAIPCTQFPR